MSRVSQPAMSLSPLLFEESLGATPALRTLVDIGRHRAELSPHRLAYTFLRDGETQEASFTYRQLDVRARAIAAHLQKRRAKGERILLVFDPGLDYVAAIIGSFYAGAIAVPVYPPDPFRLARTVPRLQAVVKNAEAKFLLSTRQVLGDAGGPLWDICREGTIPLEDICEVESEDWRPIESDPRQVALLQYTSGSTGEPRGVTLTHANLMHNFSALFDLMHVPGAVGVHWLPPYHDMGLIGGILLPLYAGRRTVLMSPLAFMQRPLRWLKAIDRYRGTTSGGPNFAYDLCARKIKPEECEGLDLSCWQVLVNGAEPVRADTLTRFLEKFAPYGLKAESLAPAYGMAETTLVISGVPTGVAPKVRTFQGKALEANQIQAVAAHDGAARKLVGCGPPALDVEVKIVDPETGCLVGRGGVGEIWVRSPSVGQGYWNRPEETERSFRATLPGHGGAYLRTGDLGFLHEGELFVVGRLKELIILAGRNFLPHDIEQTLQDAHPALKADGGAAFSIEQDGEERLVIVQEVIRPKRYDPDAVIAAMRQSLAEQFDLTAHAIALIPSGSLPKTSSGKTRRRQCREDFLAGRLNLLRQWTTDEKPSPGEAAAQAPPQTSTEVKLAALWRRLLDLETVGRQSDFFALGAQSLRVAQLLSRIAAEFGVEVSLRRLFDDPTLAGMASAIDEAVEAARDTGETSTFTVSPIPRTESAGPHPLSFSQERLWFLEQLGDGGAAAHIPLVLRVSGYVDRAALAAAIADLAARHETLRIYFHQRDGAPVQTVSDSAAIPLEFVDHSAHRTDQERHLNETLRRWTATPFDLSTAPLARVGLVKLSDEQHVLALVFHHLICDGWSVELLLQDLETAYEARRTERAPEWTGSSPRYVDFARWQRTAWDCQRQETELSWWRRRLEGVAASLDLPTDRPRTAAQAAQPLSATRHLAPSVVERLEKFARERNTTPFTIQLAAFQTLLSRYSGREDFCVGAAVAGRTRAELEGVVGCFINTVPLRGNLSGDPSFAELVQRTRSAVLEDLEHADAPLEKVIEAVQPQRRPGMAPLVQALLLHQTPSRSLRRLGDAEVRASMSDYAGLTVFDVSLVIEPCDEGWRAAIVFDRRLFDEATIAGMIDSYVAVLERVAVEPETPLSQLPIPAAAQRRLLVHQWNATEAPVPAVAGFHELFELQAAKTPTAIAIEAGEVIWTYRELNDCADRIARALRHVGVVANTPVGVHLTRKPELIAAVLGVAKAGGAYVPLDPEYPAARLELMIRDCAMPVLLTEAALANSLPPTDAFRIEVEEIVTRVEPGVVPAAASNGHRCNGRERAEHGRPTDRLAYIIYTSGSTGTPKGVMVPQRAVVNFLASMANEPGLSARDVMLAMTTVSFDIAVLELFLPLSVGARLVLASREAASDGNLLAEVIRRGNVNAMQATPATYRLLLSSGWRPARGMKLLVGGEALGADLASRLLEPDVELWNMYGPTESTVWSTIHRVTRAEDPIAIGRPIANTQVYVVDAKGRLAPQGAVGELCIGGLGVASGYWNRPELTGARFVENRFAPASDGVCRTCGQVANGRSGTSGAVPGAPPHTCRMYKSGDLVRWRSDGVLEFLGRVDSQVKVRGFRIELGEIENVLARHPDVREAAVIAPADPSGERRLAAYFAVHNGHAPAVDELRRFLGERLPAYMVPTALIELPGLPRTPAGKIDRNSLPAPEGAGFAVSAPFVEPRTPLEEQIAAAWREVLGVPRVGVDDSFFELGGHSLLAAQLASRMRERLQVELPLRELYQRPTVAALAQAVVRLRMEQEQGTRMRDLLDRLESMSDEEAAAFSHDSPEGA
jgi:amino acid adenylation domain-containing protein